VRQRIFGIFSSPEDSRNALGRVKKESWNRAEITVVIPEPNAKHSRTDDRFELGAEFFLDRKEQPVSTWPGLQASYLEGAGNIKVGTTALQHPPGILEPLGSGLDLVQREIQNQKIVAIIDVEPELIPRIRVILESKGAEIITDQG
jgi:hypothetical protein